MRSLTAQMQAHIAGEATTLATCVRLRRYPDVYAPYTAHRYWKIEVTANNGQNYCAFREVELRTAYAGADQTVPGGTVTGTPETFGGYEVTKSIDNNTTTAYATTPTFWWKYDFGAGNEKRIVEVMIQAWQGGTDAPKDFEVYYSDNDVDWTLIQDFDNETGWALSEQRAFDLEQRRVYAPVYVGYTNHTEDLVVDGVTYKASTGYTPTDVAASAMLNVDNVDLMGLIINSGIDASYIESGNLDGANVRIFMVDWQNPDNGTIPLLAGVIGQVVRRGNLFVAEVRSKAQHMQQHVVEQISNNCRASIGDERCKVNRYPLTWKPNVSVNVRTQYDAGNGTVVNPSNTALGVQFKCTTAGTTDASEPSWNTSIGATTTETGGVTWETIRANHRIGTVTSVVTGFEKTKFAVSAFAEPDGWWEQGYVVFTSGNNDGVSVEVKDFASSGGDFELFLPTWLDIEVGDTLEVFVGCDKSIATCGTKFDNVYNFRGEPFVPGRDTLLTGRVGNTLLTGEASTPFGLFK